MTAFVLFTLLASTWLLGALVGARYGATAQIRRLRRYAAHIPGDSVAVAALERAMKAERADTR